MCLKTRWLKKWMFSMAIFSIFLFVNNVYSEENKKDALGLQVEQKENIEISVGQQTIIQLKTTADRVSLSSDEIAELYMQDARNIVITGRKPGFLSVLIQYVDGNIEAYSINITTDLPLDVVVEKLKGVFKYISDLKINAVGGKIFISGDIEDPHYKDIYQDTISMYGDLIVDEVKIKGIEPSQYSKKNISKKELKELVQIDVKVADVQQSDISDLGAQWVGVDGWSLAYNLTASKTLRDGTYTLTNVGTTLKALVQKGDARVLASPKLIVESGKKADFLVGGEIPIAQSTGLTASVTWKKYGTQIEIAPEVVNENYVFIVLKAEMSALDYTNKVGTYPAVTTKSASTTLTLKDDATFVIAGLLSRTDSKSSGGLPILESVPLVGYLFKQKNVTKRNNETIIIITPHILKQKSQIEPTINLQKIVLEVENKRPLNPNIC